MLAGSGRILRSLIEDIGWIAMGGGSDIIDGGDGEASSLTTSHGWVT